MNSEQRRLVISYNGCRSAFSGRGYDPSYFDARVGQDGERIESLDETLPPMARMTVDHLYSKKRERLKEVWPLMADEHWQKDNASRDGQIQFAKRLLAREKDAEVRCLLTTRLKQLEDGADMAAIGRDWCASTFLSREPEEYRIAREQEAKEKPVRRTKLKAARKVYRRKSKARLEKARISRPTKVAGKSRFGRKRDSQEKTNTRGLRLSSKALAQMARPLLNG